MGKDEADMERAETAADHAGRDIAKDGAGTVRAGASGWRRTLAYWGLGVAEALMFLPVWLGVAIYALPVAGARVVWLLTLPVLILIGVLLSYRISKAWLRWLTAVVPGALHTLSFYDTYWHGALLFAAAWTAVVRGMAASLPKSRANIAIRYAVGLLIYFFGYTFVRLLAEWKPYLPLLTVGGAICIVILLFTVNRRLLQAETLSAEEHAVAGLPGLRNHNRMFVAGTAAGAFVVTVLLSGFLGRWLWLAMRALLQLLIPGEAKQPEPKPQPAQSRPLLPDAAPHEKSWLTQLLDVLSYALGAAIVCVFAFWLVRTLYRNRRAIAGFVRKLWRRLTAWLGRTQRPDSGAGYVDEETTIFSWESVQGAIANKWLKRFLGGRAERWNELRTNRERVRFLYREWLNGLIRKGYAARSALTPEETRLDAQKWTSGTAGEDDLIGLYYKARYSSEEITDEEVRKIRGG